MRAAVRKSTAMLKRLGTGREGASRTAAKTAVLPLEGASRRSGFPARLAHGFNVPRALAAVLAVVAWVLLSLPVEASRGGNPGLDLQAFSKPPELLSSVAQSSVALKRSGEAVRYRLDGAVPRSLSESLGEAFVIVDLPEFEPAGLGAHELVELAPAGLTFEPRFERSILEGLGDRVTLGAKPPPCNGLCIYAWEERSTYSLRARWYDPRTAQFLSEDPLDDIDSPNVYGYVAGRPHEARDPWGLRMGQSQPRVPVQPPIPETAWVPGRDLVPQGARISAPGPKNRFHSPFFFSSSPPGTVTAEDVRAVRFGPSSPGAVGDTEGTKYHLEPGEYYSRDEIERIKAFQKAEAQRGLEAYFRPAGPYADPESPYWSQLQQMDLSHPDYLSLYIRNMHWVEDKVKAKKAAQEKTQGHHFFPTYLGGLEGQTLGDLAESRHTQFHLALDRWMGGRYARRKGADYFVSMSQEEIVKDLRDFYTTADGGAFKDLLPGFERAVRETERARKGAK